MSVKADLIAIARVLFGLAIVAGCGLFMYRDGFTSSLALGALLGLVIVWPPVVLGSLRQIFAVLPAGWTPQFVLPLPKGSPSADPKPAPSTPPADGP